MPKLLTGVDNWSNTVTIPIDGEAVAQATFEPVIQQYLDNTFHLDARLDTAESDIIVNATDISTNAGDITTLNGRNIIAGAGLTGGGDLSADRTLNVVANGDGSITVNADDIQVGILATDAQHGDLGNDTLHTVATQSIAGFMSAADKTIVDNVVGAATTFHTESITTTTTFDDYNPTGWDDLQGVICVATSDLFHFTGFDAPAVGDQHYKYFFNEPSTATDFLNDDSGSSAANRLYVPLIYDSINDDRSANAWIYDSTNSLWRCFGSNGAVA